MLLFVLREVFYQYTWLQTHPYTCWHRKHNIL